MKNCRLIRVTEQQLHSFQSNRRDLEQRNNNSNLKKSLKLLTHSDDLTSASLLCDQAEWTTAAADDAHNDDEDRHADDDAHQLGKAEKEAKS